MPATSDPPDAPSNLVGTAVSGTQINLAWNDNSNNEETFRVQRRTNDGSGYGAWETIVVLGPNAVAYNDTGLTSGSTYRYRVRSCNPAGCSAWATSPAVTTP
jgi:hypothetical protein